MGFDYGMLDGSELEGQTRIKHLGFPRTEDYPNSLKVDKAAYKEYVKAHMINLDDPNICPEVVANTEFTLDMTDKGNTKLDVKIKPNVTLAEKQKLLRRNLVSREKQQGTYDSRIDTNVLILYIDNLSRTHFFRKLPKTAKWFEQFMGDDSDHELNQFFRYHSVYYNTLWTNNALYYDETGDLTGDSTNVFDIYRDNGYITGFSKDACEMTSNSFDPEVDPNSFNIHRWDHHASSFACDQNYDNTESVTSLDMLHGKNSILRRCMYGQGIHMYQMQYLKQFWEAYPDNRKIFRTHFSEAHEVSGELISHMDDDIVKMLDNFYKSGHLDDTMVMIMADHGAHSVTLRVPIIPDNSRYIENYLPLLFHLSPKSIPEGNLASLRANEQSLISSHDIYSTLALIAANQNTKEPSYLGSKIAEDRD